jgi:hypothetical protein
MLIEKIIFSFKINFLSEIHLRTKRKGEKSNVSHVIYLYLLRVNSKKCFFAIKNKNKIIQFTYICKNKMVFFLPIHIFNYQVLIK